MGKSMVKKLPRRHDERVESQNCAFSSSIFVHHMFLLSLMLLPLLCSPGSSLPVTNMVFNFLLVELCGSSSSVFGCCERLIQNV